MKIVVSVLLVIFVAFARNSVESKDCSSNDVKIICSAIEDHYWYKYKNHFLTCFVDKSMSSTNFGASVSTVKHNGSEIANLAEIEGFLIRESPPAAVKFIPFGLKKKFPRLKALQFDQTDLQGVKKENLKEFGDSLQYLYLIKCKIISIDADLFEYNPKLGFVNFNGNPIRHIDADFFKNLIPMKYFTYIGFLNAGCMDTWYSYKMSLLKYFTSRWHNEKCIDETARVETQKLIADATCDKTSKSD